MHIPSIGDQFVLTADWQFKLFNEYRNATLMELMGDTRKTSYGHNMSSIPCTIPKGAVLAIDRIYIRKGLEDFDSVTFLWKGAATESKQIEVDTWDAAGNRIKIPRRKPRRDRKSVV